MEHYRTGTKQNTDNIYLYTAFGDCITLSNKLVVYQNLLEDLHEKGAGECEKNDRQ